MNTAHRVHRNNHFFLHLLPGLITAWLAIYSGIAMAGAERPKATDRTQLLENYLPSSCYHSGHYQQEKTLAGMAQALTSTGDFIFSCQHGLIWHTQEPVIETAIYTSAGKHYILAAEKLTVLDSRVHKALGTLLNHLIGGDSNYLLKHFDIAEQNASLQLTPKQARLKRAIQRIDITPQDEQVKLVLQHSASEQTAITIFAKRSYETMDAQSCRELQPLKITACTALFE